MNGITSFLLLVVNAVLKTMGYPGFYIKFYLA